MVYKQATTVWHTDSFVLFFLANQNSDLDAKGSRKSVAFVAGKKVGKAVERNRAKRVLRALFIERIESYREGNYILIAKTNILKKDYLSLKKDWFRVLKKSKLFR